MPDTSAATLTHHAPEDVAALLDEMSDAYLDAWREVPGEDMAVKASAFRERATRALQAKNYDLVVARADGRIVGFIFGYSLRADRGWWDGLAPEPPAGFTDEPGDQRTVVIAEFEVRRSWQGQGVGHALHDAFLANRVEERATLVTRPHLTDLHALYERWGWQKVGIIPGDPGGYYADYASFVLPLPTVAR
jgi:ribosomal protein S18 acetylase RimI-like enzyme